MLGARFGRALSSSKILGANTRLVLGNHARRFPLKRFQSSLPAQSSPVSSGSDSTSPPKPRLSITFTCTAPNCSHRSTHEFSKHSYERGIVIIQCPNCKNRHLIADHLGWFKDHEATQGGKFRTIEDFMRAKGEKVQRGKIGEGGVIEYNDE